MTTSKFASRLWLLAPHVAAIGVLVLCARLAFWQVDRAGEKQWLIDQWQSAPAGALAEHRQLQQFAPAAGMGRFDGQRHVLLDNQIRNHRPGVHVLTPFLLDNGDLIMVNRGWQPWERRGAEFPVFATPQEPFWIQGRISEPPQVGLRLGAALPLNPESWPNLITYYDGELIGAALGVAPAERILLLDPEHPAHLSGDPWPGVNMGPERHIGYAVQWASIGLAVLLIWVVLSYRSWRHR